MCYLFLCAGTACTGWMRTCWCWASAHTILTSPSLGRRSSLESASLRWGLVALLPVMAVLTVKLFQIRLIWWAAVFRMWFRVKFVFWIRIRFRNCTSESMVFNFYTNLRIFPCCFEYKVVILPLCFKKIKNFLIERPGSRSPWIWIRLAPWMWIRIRIEILGAELVQPP
jgi:hypothetical protein